jgi:hypothetical protein
MKLTIVSIMSAIVLFAGNLQPVVAATSTLVFQPDGSTSGIVLLTPKQKAKILAKKKLQKMYPKTWKKEWSSLAKLWGKESAWNHRADNPHSSAYGIAQVLRTPEGSTIEYQIKKGLEYIVHRYERPTRAWDFWQRNYYY